MLQCHVTQLVLPDLFFLLKVMWVIYFKIYCFCSQFPWIASKNTCNEFIILRCVIGALLNYTHLCFWPLCDTSLERPLHGSSSCPWPEAQVLWVTMHNESVCVCERKNWVSWEMKMDFHFLAPVWLIAVKKSPPSRPECRALDLTITGHALNGSSELMFALDLFLRERWRLRNNSMMPNSSPPKRKRSSKWIRWPWSSSWSGLRHSGKSTCFYVTWVLGNVPSEIFTYHVG